MESEDSLENDSQYHQLLWSKTLILPHKLFQILMNFHWIHILPILVVAQNVMVSNCTPIR